MRPIIPSTTALRVFEAVARHLTFTGAAEELFLTQSAVSKQIGALEEALGVMLFVRVNRGVVLTDLGSLYLKDIRPLLAQLALASAKLIEAANSAGTTSLTLRILAIIGDRWLLPRFDAFTKAYPNVDVQFTSLLSRDGTEQKEADGEFKFGEGSWPGAIADYLFGHEMLLVASPNLLASRPLDSLEKIASFPLLHHFQVPDAWRDFFSNHRLSNDPAPKAIRYEFYSTLIKGAVSGMGLALVPAIWVQDELARGELVNPLAITHMSRNGYFFVIPEHKQSNPALAMFRSWLLAEARATRLLTGTAAEAPLAET